MCIRDRTTAKKATKKAAAKKTAKAEKKELVPEVFVQFDGNEDVVANVIERAKEAFTADGHRASSIKSLKVYLKPEEYAAYYVINDTLSLTHIFYSMRRSRMVCR